MKYFESIINLVNITHIEFCLGGVQSRDYIYKTFDRRQSPINLILEFGLITWLFGDYPEDGVYSLGFLSSDELVEDTSIMEIDHYITDDFQEILTKPTVKFYAGDSAVNTIYFDNKESMETFKAKFKLSSRSRMFDNTPVSVIFPVTN